jgi:CRISPR/Cas system endoribonuclease Cas6 (RAMP superfamily)
MDLIEYDDLMDEYLSTFEEFKDGENKENGFNNFVKVLNIILLISSTPEDIAKGIINQINDTDNFNWRYV